MENIECCLLLTIHFAMNGKKTRTVSYAVDSNERKKCRKNSERKKLSVYCDIIHEKYGGISNSTKIVTIILLHRIQNSSS